MATSCGPEPDQHHLGRVDVPGVPEQLLHQLAAAFTHAHVTQRAIARVGVGAEDHIAAGGEGLAGILMDNSLVGRHIDTAIFLRGGKAEHVVVLVDRTADGAQGIVAVGHCVRQRELLEAAGAGRLDDAHVSDVMGDHRIKTDAHFLALAAVDVMGAENSIGDRVFTGLVRRRQSCRVGDDRLSVQEIHTMRNQFYHSLLEFKSYEVNVFRSIQRISSKPACPPLRRGKYPPPNSVRTYPGAFPPRNLPAATAPRA